MAHVKIIEIVETGSHNTGEYRKVEREFEVEATDYTVRKVVKKITKSSQISGVNVEGLIDTGKNKNDKREQPSFMRKKQVTGRAKFM